MRRRFAQLPARELRAAAGLAAEMGFACRVVETHEHANPAYSANAPDRCFFCKVELFERLRDIAAREGWQAVADGVHAADAADHAHGIAAARRNGVVSPLMEAGIDKSEVRTLARELGLPAWDKPAMPCLASRVPHGTPITPALLRRVEAAEDVLAALGFRQFRVRHHGELARRTPAGRLRPRAGTSRGAGPRRPRRRLPLHYDRPGRFPQRLHAAVDRARRRRHVGPYAGRATVRRAGVLAARASAVPAGLPAGPRRGPGRGAGARRVHTAVNVPVLTTVLLVSSDSGNWLAESIWATTW